MWIAQGMQFLSHAMKPTSYPPSPKHYLFMLPPTTTIEEQHGVVKAAKDLLPDGYVYVASAHEHTMEDRESIRFMPLRTNDLPCFAAVAGVMVARDEHLALVARQVYPGTPVMVFDPAEPSQERMAMEVPAPQRVTPSRRTKRVKARELPQAA